MRNVGALDRSVRILAGAALVSLVYVGPQTSLGWVGLIALLTGLLGVCPAYHALGLDSRTADDGA